MTLLNMVKTIAAIVTVATGLLSFVRPRSVLSFTGLGAPGPRGVNEIRAVLGLGAAALPLRTPGTFQMLGIVYLVIGATRIVGLFIDQSIERSNIISLAIEIVFGLVLVI
jgi:hypothetical protein